MERGEGGLGVWTPPRRVGGSEDPQSLYSSILLSNFGCVGVLEHGRGQSPQPLLYALNQVCTDLSENPAVLSRCLFFAILKCFDLIILRRNLKNVIFVSIWSREPSPVKNNTTRDGVYFLSNILGTPILWGGIRRLSYDTLDASRHLSHTFH